MWWKVVLSVLVGSGATIAGAILYGRSRWRARTDDLRQRLERNRTGVEPKAFDSGELNGLPAPVQRYFRTVLNEGQPIISAVSLEHTGTFNMSETAEQWKPFTSNQRVITRKPGFDWNARISAAPGISVYVHDAYVAGEGILDARLMGLVKLAYMRGTREVARGELMRFLAEAVWYPTALLPNQGVHWQEVDERNAIASITDDSTAVTLLFQFDAAGLVACVKSESRDRTVNRTTVSTPWEVSCWNYQRRENMLLPTEGEVRWLLADGYLPYWRGRVTNIDFEFPQ
jgi:hypothetical protein